MPRISLLPSLLLAGSLTACVTEGRDFNSNTSWIEKGRTTQTDVRNILKEPYAVGNSSGEPTWTYGYYHYKLIGKSQQKELKFYWKPDGTVESFSFTSSFPDDTGAAGVGGSKPAGAAAPKAQPKDDNPSF